MGNTLRLLIIEDSELDVLMLVEHLKHNGFDPYYRQVQTQDAMLQALQQESWDVIISDYILPQFSGKQALEVFKASGLDLPFILVSGKIGEDVAVEAIKSGAYDYILKDNLVRLVPAIQRGRAEAEERQKLKQAELELDLYHKNLETLVAKRTEKLRKVIYLQNLTEQNLMLARERSRELEQIINLSPVVVFLWQAQPGWPVEYVSENIAQFGYSVEDFSANKTLFAQIIHPEDLERIAAEVEEYRSNNIKHFIQYYRIITKSGVTVWVEDRTWSRFDPQGNLTHFQGIILDVSKRKKLEDDLQLAKQELEIKVRERTLELINTNYELQLEIAQRSLMQAKEAQLIKELTFLSQTAMKFVELPPQDTLEEFILNKAADFITRGILINCQYLPRQTAMQFQAMQGKGEPYAQLVSQYRKNYLKRKITIKSDLAIILKSGKLIKLARHAYQDELNKMVPPRLKELKSVLMSGNFYILGLYGQNKILGALIFIIPEADALKEQSVIETFAHQAAIALLRKTAEDHIRSYQKLLRNLSAELAVAEERERHCIAAELHDHIGQNLALAQMQLKVLLKKNHLPETESQGVENLIQEAIDYSRSLTWELSHPLLYELGLEPAIEWLVEDSRKKYSFALSYDNDHKPKPVHEELRVFLFKALQELLLNVAKHAHASNARLTVTRHQSSIKISLEDDGVGFKSIAPKAMPHDKMDFGLFNIRERLLHFEGNLEIKSGLRKGTQVIITAPLKTSRRRRSNVNEY